MSVNLDRTDFLDRVIVTQSMKKVLDTILRRFLECVVRIDIDDRAISRRSTTWAKSSENEYWKWLTLFTISQDDRCEDWLYQRREWSIDDFYQPSWIVDCNILERRAWFQWTRHETSLDIDFELEAMLFDESFQMILRAVKVETEQKKILKYINAKKKVSWRERKEKIDLYRRASASEMNATLSVISSSLLLFSLLHFSFFSSFALHVATFVNNLSSHKTWKVKLRMLNRWVEDTSEINCRNNVTLQELKIANIESWAHEKYRATCA